MQRINSFLSEEEVPSWASSLMSYSSQNLTQHLIGFAGARLTWHAPKVERLSNSQFHLGPLDVLFPVGKVSLVTGATGSGKSAMLAALLGGMLNTSRLSP